jgi:hypothetical protein
MRTHRRKSKRWGPSPCRHHMHRWWRPMRSPSCPQLVVCLYQSIYRRNRQALSCTFRQKQSCCCIPLCHPHLRTLASWQSEGGLSESILPKYSLTRGVSPSRACRPDDAHTLVVAIVMMMATVFVNFIVSVIWFERKNPQTPRIYMRVPGDLQAIYSLNTSIFLNSHCTLRRMAS